MRLFSAKSASYLSTLRPLAVALSLLCALHSLAGIDAKAAKPRQAKQSAAITEADKARAESQKASIDHKLEDLQSALQAKETEREAANNDLQKSDTAISEANKKLRQLEQDRRRIEREIQSLRRNETSVGRDLSSASDTLELITKRQFLTLRKPAWQALVNGQNPYQIYRDSAMLTYLARAQQSALLTLEGQRQQISNVKAQAQSRQEELLKIKRQEEEQRQILLSEKRDRQQAVAKLGREIQSQQSEIERLKKDQARLSSLVNTIEEKLKKQAEAEQRAREAAAREEARRQARLKEERARQEARRKSTGSRNSNSSTQPDQEPPSSAANTAVSTPAKPLPGFRGKLMRPVSGRITARYGDSRGARGTQWQGIQYSAPEGTDVVACAEGRVVFADWLRGYGNLIIIDHGKGYLSVYGNNETLYKSVGDYVKQGETISAVGSSGGNTEAGLYFELRHNGKPINPSPWISP